MKKKKLAKKLKNLLVIVSLVICFSGVAIIGERHLDIENSNNREKKQEELQNTKLRELQEAEGLYSEDSIVLNDTTKEQAELIAEKIGGKVRITEDGSYATIYLPEGRSIEEIYKNEEYRMYLEEISLDYYVNISAVDANNNELFPARPEYSVTDAEYINQQYLDYVNLKDSWKVSKGSGVRVAVIDTGIDTDHEEFVGKISEKSYNASTDKLVRDYGVEVVEDEQGHGTAVAGVISATMDNQIGITGIAPETELVIIKCECDANGNFTRGSDLVFGLAYAIECDADVINMSFETPQNIFAKYTKLAVDSDIICIASAGNEGIGIPNYPAADENVIGVGALETSNWSLAKYSNFGDNSDVLAPGTVYTTNVGGSYGYRTGTSLSGPIVAATTALYLSKHPNLEYSEVCELFRASSIDIGTLGEDWYYGFGALDIYSFLCEEKGTITYEMLTDEVENQEQIFVRGRTIQYMPEPVRENVVFDGWYYDMECTDECEYYTDVFTSDVTLYAKWINEDEGSVYTYTILEDGTVEIQAYTGKRRFLSVPSMIEGRTVTSIGMDAFAYNSRLRTITLPSTITQIGERAFYQCTSLVSMDIPEQVTIIGANAFSGCISLNNIGIATNGELREIGTEAFSECGIRQFEIPVQVNNIGKRLFVGSTSLRKITVTEGNDTYQIINDALYDATGKCLLYYPAALTGKYVVSETATGIADSAFAYARASEVILPNGLEYIEENGFSYSNISNINIPESVGALGRGVFKNCSNLFSVEISEGGKCTRLSGEIFGGCERLKQIQIPTQIEVIDGAAFSCSGLSEIVFSEGSVLKEIGGDAFYGCSLQKINIPGSVKYIGANAFAYCTNLTQVLFDAQSQCESIEQGAYLYCKSLDEIEFPDTLKAIGEQAFFGSGLSKVEIGEGLNSIGDGAFAACQKLKSFVVAETNKVYASYEDVLFNKEKTELILYPGAKVGEYTFPVETKLVRDYAFASAEKLTKINVNSGLEELGEYAFSGCISMATPVLPKDLMTIGANTFEYCSSMTGKLIIPKKVKNIGPFAFFNDYELSSIELEPESEMSRIGYGAFAYCGIQTFTIPGNVQNMAQEVFMGCKNLLTITFEADSQLENLAAWTFEGADELRQITFEEGSELALIEARACQGLDKLEKVDLTYCTKLNKIGNYAFTYCKSLSNIALPENVTEIGRYAFSGCASLAKVDIPKVLNFIGRYAFANTNNANVYFKASILPVYLEENWDYGIAGYYMGVNEIKTSGDWTYALTEDNKVSIISYNGSDSNITLDKIDGYEVVSIGGKAFQNNTTLQNISLPESLTGIYQAAFAGTTQLKEVTIPSKVVVIDNEAFRGSGIENVMFEGESQLTTLGRYAFADTMNLTTFTLPDGVEEIRDYTFYNSNLSQIVFGADTILEEIGRYAFSKSELNTVEMPETLKKIDYYAFSENKNLTFVNFENVAELQIFGNAFYKSGLTSVFIPANVIYIGELCFTNCEVLTSIEVEEKNEAYSSIEGVLFDKAKKKLITCPAGKTGRFEVASTVTSLAFAAFEGSKLSEIVLPIDSQLSTIGYRAFYDCDNLTSINIPKSVLSIENYAFAYDDNLESVTVAEDSQLGGIYKSAFYNCAKLTKIEVPECVQEISDYAFYGCNAMNEVQFAENSQLRGIFSHAFEYSGITKFVMPKNLLEIGEYAFRGAKIVSLTSNDSVIDIGDYAFADCGLKDTTILTLPETLEHLGSGVLRGAVALEELTIPFVNEKGLGELFDIQLGNEIPPSIHTVHILKGDTICDNAFVGWTNIQTITLPEELSEIGYMAFAATGITNIDLPKGLTRIGGYAFSGTLITDITLSENLSIIEESAFNNCMNLKKVEFPLSLSNIGKNAFLNTGIEEIYIPKNVIVIGDGAFSDCNNLRLIEVAQENSSYATLDGILYNISYERIVCVPKQIEGSISLPNGLKIIGEAAFRGCEKLTQVICPDTVTTIEKSAFENCSIKEIKLPDSLEKIKDNAFQCSGLESIVIPDSVTQMGYGCFESCVNLKSVEIGNGLNSQTSLFNMFYYCPKLEVVVINSEIETIGYGAFAFCYNLQEITLPESLKGIEKNAFQGCSELQSLYIPKNVKSLEGAFADCEKLERLIVAEDNPYLTSVDGILYDNSCEKILFVPCSLSGKVSIPEGVKEITNGVFRGRNQLIEIILPDSLEIIGESCFEYCRNLEKISGGNGIKKIGYNAFSECAYANNPDNWEDGILYVGKAVIDSDSSMTELVVKEGTIAIGNSAFRDSSVLEAVWLPDSVKYIQTNAFDLLPELKRLRIGKGVLELEQSAISYCDKLESISLPKGLELMEVWPFSGCPNLKYIKIESAENTIPLYLFDSVNNTGYMETLVMPYSKGFSATYMENMDNLRLVINSTNAMDLNFLSQLAGTNVKVYCNVGAEEWESGWNHNLTTYYKDEWNLATFYVDDVIVKMNPLTNKELLQTPAETLIHEYLPVGATFKGWDINGDGQTDTVPTVLTENLEAHAVLEVPIESMKITNISTEDEQMEVGQSKQAKLTYAPQRYNQREVVTWTSSDESVATVSQNGVITAVSEGAVTITATLDENSEITTQCNITVIPVQYGIKLKETKGVLNVGEVRTLEPMYVLPKEDTNDTILISSEEAVATVSGNEITAIAPGTTVITISHGEYSAEYYLTVCLPLSGIALEETEGGLQVGETKRLSVVYTPMNATDDKGICWYSDNSKVARVNSDGIVTAVSPGTATIHALVGKFDVTYKVTVTAPIKWIILNTTTGTMRIDRTKQLEVIYEPSYTTDDKTVVWESSNDIVASVDEKGLVTAHEAGTAVITAAVGEHTATYTVTVVGIKDKNTGIIITNSDDTSMDEAIFIDVEELDTETVEGRYKTAWELFSEFLRKLLADAIGHKEVTTVFDISLLQENVTIQPDKTVDVEIPVPKDMLPEDVIIYRMEEDGTITDMHPEYVDGRFCFKTDHFSVYAIGAKSKTVSANSVVLSHENISLCPKQTISVNAIIEPETAENQEVLWMTENDMIAKVDADGVITAVSEGNVKITAMATDDSGAFAVCTVRVKHTWNEGKLTVEPNCMEKGEIIYTCTNCMEIKTEEVSELGHEYSEEWIVDKEATCKEAGSISHHCTREGCDAKTDVTEVPFSEHMWNEGTLTTGPGCTTVGEKTYQCSVCEATKTEEVEALGHAYADEWTVDKEATHTEEGSKSHHCTRTGCTEKTDITIIPKQDHKWNEGSITVQSTCTTAGEILYICTECGKTQNEVIEAQGHEYSTGWTTDKEATCKEKGSQSHHCTREGCDAKTDVTEIPLTDHTWNEGEVTTKPTCTTVGEKTYQCSVCETTKNEEAEVLGHAYADEWTVDKEATHTEEGSKSHHCTRTGCTEKTDITIIPKQDHKWNEGSITVQSTCTTAGEILYTCTECGKTQNEVIEAQGHEYSTGWTTDKEATCKEKGSQSRHCTRESCDAKADVTEIPVVAHIFIWITDKAATTTDSGLKHEECSICGQKRNENTIINKVVAEHKHSYKTAVTKATTEKNGSIVSRCSTCGEIESTEVIYYPQTVTLSQTVYTYNGKALKPTVEVEDSNGEEIDASNYTVEYTNNKSVGQAKVTITFHGNYSGNITQTFTINPMKTSISKTTAKSKGFAVKWKKQTKETTGYEIQYSTSKKFKGAKSLTIKKNKTVSITVKKLNAKKSYFVRIRTYKTVGGKKYYSEWSTAKKVTTKK